MTDETALILALARGDPVLPGAESVNWNQACVLAARHEVDALCYWQWSRQVERGAASGTQVPRRWQQRFRQGYAHHLLRNESLVHDLETLATLLNAGGIEGLFLKGPWLALEAWPDPGTRPVSDIDLCVPERSFAMAVEALREAGYSPIDPLPLAPRSALRRAHYGRQLRFTAPARRQVELHFRLVNVGPPAADEAWVWETARELRPGGTTIRVPGPEATLLQLLLHAAQHRFALLRFMYDIRWALERDGSMLDNRLLLSQIRRLRCRNVAYHALTLAQELAGADIGTVDLDALRPFLPQRRLFGAMWHLSAVKRLEAARPSTELESPMLYLLGMGSLRDKARYVSGILRESGRGRHFRRHAKRSISTCDGKNQDLSGTDGGVGTMDGFPKLREEIVVRRIDDEVVAYDPASDRTYRLTLSAGAILDFCDGQHSPEGIAHEIAPMFSTQAEDIVDQVREALRSFSEEGLFATHEVGSTGTAR